MMQQVEQEHTPTAAHPPISCPRMGTRAFAVLRRVCALVVVLLMSAAGLHAQINTATLQGLVTDPSGAVIEGANITVTNTETAVARSTKSDSAGRYTVTSLQPGHYTVEAVTQGFTSVKQENLELQVGQVESLDLALRVGSEAQTVTVTSSTTALESTDTSLGHLSRTLHPFQGGVERQKSCRLAT